MKENVSSVDEAATNLFWQQVLAFGVEVIDQSGQSSKQSNAPMFDVLP